jgi:hypothetical protein
MPVLNGEYFGEFAARALLNPAPHAGIHAEISLRYLGYSHQGFAIEKDARKGCEADSVETCSELVPMQAHTKPPHPLRTCFLSINQSASRFGSAYLTPVRLCPRLLRNCPLPSPHQPVSFDLSLVQCSVESSFLPAPPSPKTSSPTV